jgi:hypothetical protein
MRCLAFKPPLVSFSSLEKPVGCIFHLIYFFIVSSVCFEQTKAEETSIRQSRSGAEVRHRYRFGSFRLIGLIAPLFLGVTSLTDRRPMTIPQ